MFVRGAAMPPATRNGGICAAWWICGTAEADAIDSILSHDALRFGFGVGLLWGLLMLATDTAGIRELLTASSHPAATSVLFLLGSIIAILPVVLPLQSGGSPSNRKRHLATASAVFGRACLRDAAVVVFQLACARLPPAIFALPRTDDDRASIAAARQG
jgi:hypothetical protein